MNILHEEVHFDKPDTELMCTTITQQLLANPSADLLEQYNTFLLHLIEIYPAARKAGPTSKPWKRRFEHLTFHLESQRDSCHGSAQAQLQLSSQLMITSTDRLEEVEVI